MKKSELFFGFLRLPIDVLMILVSFVVAYYLRAHVQTSEVFFNIGVREYLKYAYYLVPVWVALFALNGLYALKRTDGIFAELYKVLIASSTAILLLIVYIFSAKLFFFSRLILVFTAALSIILIFFGRLFLRSIQAILLSFGVGERQVLFIGDSRSTALVFAEMAKKKDKTYKVAGFLSDQENSNSGLKYLGTIADLIEVIKSYKVDEVIMTENSLSSKKMMAVVKACDDLKVTFKYVPDIYSLVLSNFRSSLIGTIPVLELKSIPLDGWGRILKRIADIVFSFIFLIILFIPMLLIALIIKLTSKGSVFFVHDRIGRDEKVFKFYKFRTMYVDKCDFEQKGVWTKASDEQTRVTAFGKFLRKSSLDELPQLYNILIGDMSFVGPRPEQPVLVDKFEEKIPDYFRRHKVKTGLTSWASVNGLKGDTSIEERVRYDIYYIENWSMWFDLKIIIKTFFLVIYEAFEGKSEYRARS